MTEPSGGGPVVAPDDPVVVVGNESLPWVNGSDVYASMEPAFRDNLGQDPARVADLLSKYWVKLLWGDDSSRRIDHVRTDPGYRDLSEAYHDSVEEAFFLAGEARLSAEGRFEAGDYFWRPPGWVHSARSAQGFEALLMMEGDDLSEGSGRVSRVVCDDHQAGLYARPAVDGALGPRGYVRRAETRFAVWRPHDDATTRLAGDGAELRSKLLSLNDESGARTVLVRLHQGWSSASEAVDRDRFLVSLGPGLVVGGEPLSPLSLVRIPAHVAPPRLAAVVDLDLFCKVGAPR